MMPKTSTSTWSPTPLPGPPPAQSSLVSNQNVLDFDTAMTQFKSMFPNTSATTIEKILRAHNGDVTNAINDLLSHSADSPVANPQSTPSTSSVYVGEKDARHGKNKTAQRETHHEDLSCVDDEKIALLMQNREFLEYLGNDARFMREIGEHWPSSSRHSTNYHRRRYRGQSLNTINHSSTTVYTPPVMEAIRDGTWRVCAPPVCYQYNHHNYPYRLSNDEVSAQRYTSRQYEMPPQEHEFEKEMPEALPDGPIVNYDSDSIPEGPLLGHFNSDGQQGASSKNWSQRVKSHLSRIGKNGAKHTTGHNEDEKMLEAPFVDYSVSDDNFAHRLRNMSKSSKEMLLNLAKRFTHSRKFSHTNRMTDKEAEHTFDHERQNSLKRDFDQKQKL